MTGFVGTYTGEESQGIYHLELSSEAPQFERSGVTTVGDNPSFLALHPSESILYTVHEVVAGGVSAFRVESDSDGTVRLTRLGRTESGADGPCHCSVHPSGNALFVAHYAGGAVSVIPIRSDGALVNPSDIIHHEGSSRHPNRQREPHPHMATIGPNGRFVYVPDLGTDEVVVYEFRKQNHALRRVGSVNVPPGAGPRHLDFHPEEGFAYLINELDSTLFAFKWDPDTGDLDVIDTVSTLPAGFDGENIAADVHVHPMGDWVYGSNRGHDSITIYRIFDDGTLQFRRTEPSGGSQPRHFAIDRSGRWLFALNRATDDITTFSIDAQTGELEPTGDSLSIPRPVCLATAENFRSER